MGLYESKIMFPCDATRVKLQGNETHLPLVWRCLISWCAHCLASKPQADPTTWDTSFLQVMTCCGCVWECPAARGRLYPGGKAELRREEQVAAAYEQLLKTESGPCGHAVTPGRLQFDTAIGPKACTG